MVTWHFELALPGWIYNQVMGAPVEYHIGHLSPRVVVTWGWR